MTRPYEELVHQLYGFRGSQFVLLDHFQPPCAGVSHQHTLQPDHMKQPIFFHGCLLVFAISCSMREECPNLSSYPGPFCLWCCSRVSCMTVNVSTHLHVKWSFTTERTFVSYSHVKPICAHLSKALMDSYFIGGGGVMAIQCGQCDYAPAVIRVKTATTLPIWVLKVTFLTNITMK